MANKVQQDEKQRRLEEALRANLRRRKAQARGRKQEAAEDPASGKAEKGASD